MIIGVVAAVINGIVPNTDDNTYLNSDGYDTTVSTTVADADGATADSKQTAANNKQPAASNKTAAKKTAKQNTPATNRFPNLPNEFKDHVYMDSRAYGGCDTLTGNVKITVVFVNDGMSSWNDTAISEEKADHTEAAAVVTAAAKKYGKTVNISFVYKTASVSGTPDMNSGTSWAERALKAAGLPAIDSLNNSLEKQYGVKEAPVVLCVNRTGRSFAQSNTGGEHIVLYADGNALAHELLHIFGAEDLYFPTTTSEAAKSVFGKSIMLSSAEPTVDSLNAYLVGWTDTLDANAKAFLQKTGSLTNAIMAEEYKKETYTGYVTNWQLGENIFTGNLKSGIIADGKVFLKYANGTTFDGYYKNGQATGQGTMIWANGDTYVGAWVNGQRSGQGTYTWASGGSYTGNFTNGKFHGQGTYTYADGSKYVGEWVNDQRTGQGTYTWASGASYTGSFKDGKFHGQGTYTYADGNKYVGAWIDDQRNGQGTFTYANGTVYTGNFKDNKFNGQGTMTWSSGNKYVGAWVNGQRTGQGTFTYADGTVYTGSLKDGKFNGQGTMVWSNGSKYVGAWVDGQRTGQGTFTWANGTVYTGSFKDGKLHGQGTCTWPDGATQTGIWENDTFVG